MAGLDPFIWKGAFGAGPIGTRVFSTLGRPSLCAYFFAVAIPMALTLALDPETPKTLRWAALSLTPLAVVVAILTGAPPAMAAVCVSCLLYALIVPMALRTRAALTSAALALLLALVAGAAALGLDGRGRESLSYTSQFRKATVAAELRMVAEHPLIGFGPGSFSVHYPRFRAVDIIRLESGHNTMAQYPELPLLGAAVEAGVLGAALWLWLFGASVDRSERTSALQGRRSAQSVYAAGFPPPRPDLAAMHLVYRGHRGGTPGPWQSWPQAWLLWRAARPSRTPSARFRIFAAPCTR